ncbi:MAG: DUF899 domain-containing protein [Rhizobacter sp.]|nr:DUF899 domain-containing protein [Rhizobacter sp.]
MKEARIGTREEWLAARKALVAEEKAHTRARDALSERRRALPWYRIDKAYRFKSGRGPMTLADLFAGRSQLVVYHFMYGPDWEQGCKSRSFWADSFDGIVEHLAQRDVTLACVSIAPLAMLDAFKQRMGWHFNWVSSEGSDFNADFGVSPPASGPMIYNFDKAIKEPGEMPGVSVFAKDASGAIFHTYSCYARGLDMLNSAYQILDLVPKGRDEGDLPYSMSWLRHKDRYGTDSS